MLTLIVYITALCAGIALVGLSLVTFIRPGFQFWPPPNAESWQHRTFRGLFRVFFLGLVILSFLDVGSALQLSAEWRYVVGIPLSVVGFGLALYWTHLLGWRNAFGDARGLKTEDAYRWSRNPIYVVSIVGMIGLGIIVNSALVHSLLALWALLYVIAPFLEEPWLARQYGREFELYKAQVPRFFGFPTE